MVLVNKTCYLSQNMISIITLHRYQMQNNIDNSTEKRYYVINITTLITGKVHEVFNPFFNTNSGAVTGV